MEGDREGAFCGSDLRFIFGTMSKNLVRGAFQVEKVFTCHISRPISIGDDRTSKTMVDVAYER